MKEGIYGGEAVQPIENLIYEGEKDLALQKEGLPRLVGVGLQFNIVWCGCGGCEEGRTPPC